MKKYLLLWLVLAIAPGDAPGRENDSISDVGPVAGVMSETGPENYHLLFLGNSHSAANQLPLLVATLIETGLADATAASERAPGFRFLGERLGDGVTEPLLNSQSWTHVVLQAQKYSTSGLYSYPTDGTEEWIRKVKAKGARPILFPEWPRRGNTEEGLRVHNLHLGISSREPACVAPIGLAWEESIDTNPSLLLHARDGNHSNLNGALLTAYVLYEVITGTAAGELPYISSIGVSADSQQKLRQVASDVVADNQETCVLAPVTETGDISDPGIPALTPRSLIVLAILLAGFGSLVLRKYGAAYRKPT